MDHLPCGISHFPHLTYVLNVQLMDKLRHILNLDFWIWAWLDPISKVRWKIFQTTSRNLFSKHGQNKWPNVNLF